MKTDTNATEFETAAEINAHYALSHARTERLFPAATDAEGVRDAVTRFAGLYDTSRGAPAELVYVSCVTGEEMTVRGEITHASADSSLVVVDTPAGVRKAHWGNVETETATGDRKIGDFVELRLARPEDAYHLAAVKMNELRKEALAELAADEDEDEETCPDCGGHHTERIGTAGDGGDLYGCNECWHGFRAKRVAHEQEKRRAAAVRAALDAWGEDR